MAKFTKRTEILVMAGDFPAPQTGANMGNRLIYDLPTRIFHWIFAGLFVLAFVIAKVLGDESPAFSYHMLAGFILGFVVVLRIVWGVVGTRYSRFSSFALNPKDLVSYFFGILSGEKKKWTGHNPASSWAAISMLVLALGLGVTGYLMASGQRETFEDVHELLANGFLVVVIMHVTGLVLHTLRHQDDIALSMVHGEKRDVPNNAGISGSRPIVAALALALIVTFAIQLLKSFDSEKQTLDVFGARLQLNDQQEHHDE